jgi:hypothetical protein
MFTFAADRKQRVLKILEDAAQAIRDGHAEVVEDIMVGINSDGNGYTRHKDTFFFGIEFRLTAKAVSARPQPVHTAPAVSAPIHTAPAVQPLFDTTDAVSAAPITPERRQWEMPDTGGKMSEHFAQTCKVAGTYHCPKKCGFTTESSTGLKKHFNRCGTP